MKLHIADAGGDGVVCPRPTREALRSPADSSSLGEQQDTFGISPTLDFFRRARQLQIDEALVGHASRVQAGDMQNS